MEGVDDQVGAHMVGDRPAREAPGIQVDDGGQVEEAAVTDPHQVASSRVARLALVPDPHDPLGRRNSLVLILVLTACGTPVAGSDCLAAIWQWAACR